MTAILRGYSSLPSRLLGGAIAIGNFDGLHLGHRSVIRHLTDSARTAGIPALMMRFYPHPRRVFTPQQGPRPMLRLSQQCRILDGWGVDGLTMLHFNTALMQLEAEAFVREILVGRFQARHVVTGEDFHFGYRRGGNAETLRHWGQTYGFTAQTVPPVEQDGLRVASSCIRHYLSSGEIEAANRMLGRPHAIAGYVAHGDRKGRELGMPTANIELPGLHVPRYGVYVARARWQGGECPAVLNIGERPTVGLVKPRLEAHLLGFSGDLYGQWLECELHGFLRPERKFASFSELQAQLRTDKQQAQHWWSERS